jgi:hypothetical protein
VSSLRPPQFKSPATEGTAPASAVSAPRPPGARICAPGKTRC